MRMTTGVTARGLGVLLALSIPSAGIRGEDVQVHDVSAPPLRGGGPIGLANDPCVQEAERADAQRAIDRGVVPVGPPLAPGAAPPKFTFYPVGGNLYRDLYTTNFVDLDPGTGLLDWDCTNHTYNGHRGNDTLLRSFGEQEVGVPVYAALDGLVTDTHDGEPDHNVECNGALANYVIIHHGDGRVGWYWHLRNGSVQVGLGDYVRAGQQIGLTASSGCSTWPHLHFEVQDFGAWFEPYAGPCNIVESAWVDQTPIRRDTYLFDLGVTEQELANHPGLPYTLPRTGQMSITEEWTFIWMLALNLPAQSTYRWQFLRPNGSTAWDRTFNWNNPAYRFSWWWFRFNLTDMHSITGTWRARFYINGVLEAEAPIEVVSERDPGFNRAPEPIAVAIDPPVPLDTDVIHARVETDLLVDDVDYDIVRYEYLWTVNDGVVRRVTSAGHSDALPRLTAQSGDVVRCVVTPRDGVDSGPAAAAAAVVTDKCPPDLDDDGSVGFLDLVALLGAWGSYVPCPPFAAADIDDDCVVGFADLLALLGAWGDCPP